MVRERHTGRQEDRETDRQRQTKTGRDIQRQTMTETDRDRQKLTERQIQTKNNKQSERERVFRLKSESILLLMRSKGSKERGSNFLQKALFSLNFQFLNGTKVVKKLEYIRS